MGKCIFSAHILYCMYKSQLVDDVKQHNIFKRWFIKDTVGDSPVPIELLVPRFFHYCGHTFTMEDLETNQLQFMLKHTGNS